MMGSGEDVRLTFPSAARSAVRCGKCMHEMHWKACGDECACRNDITVVTDWFCDSEDDPNEPHEAPTL